MPALDGLRGVAILMVLFHHLLVYEPHGIGGRLYAGFAEFCGHGVDLFFCLSGFLIAGVLSRNERGGGFARDFWVRRVAKILPLYLLLVAGVFVALDPLLGLAGQAGKLQWLRADHAAWPWYLLVSSNIHNFLEGRFTNPAMDVAWSLAVEIQFYLLAFLVSRLELRRHWLWVCGAAVVVAMASRFVLWRTGYGWLPILVCTPCRLDAFALGAVVCLAPRILDRLSPAGLLVLVPVAVLSGWSRETPFVQLFGYTLVALVFGGLVARAALPTGNAWLRSRFLCWCGQISYAVYLVHLPLRAMLRDYLLPKERVLFGVQAWAQQLAFHLLAGLASLLLGWLAWRLVEDPARRWLIRRFASAKVEVTPVGQV
jgi:peptidoglycan/LPS O-acetylase OafA/YrhL